MDQHGTRRSPAALWSLIDQPGHCFHIMHDLPHGVHITQPAVVLAPPPPPHPHPLENEVVSGGGSSARDEPPCEHHSPPEPAGSGQRARLRQTLLQGSGRRGRSPGQRGGP